MTAEEFYITWNDHPSVRQMLLDIAKSFTRNREHQAELYYRAWMHLAELTGDGTELYYFAEGYQVMSRYYTLYLMPDEVSRWPADAPGLRRAKRRLHFFLRKVA